ncbi:5-methyltetrahydropteroyltriglutamate--homocysteine methyltransferase [Sphingobium wenxiniae]|uniref:5-methyltetrahydropteroyltriglutamate--homocysteine methyltransferase n=2 Tax=Sphingobium TaxID=165695 RepID=T0FZK1_9SPHN|nr:MULTISPECIES: 5-methyltetrahydropteroyltriglutamate--homocysteine S-methyltransferase [Sphingobium]EQA96795.1 5-methyltetrahydropteroyltriglutamate--homocysteine methyltransferase [Sphingobium baderi LL03]KMS63963.1 5-methyltetrahydropteroyltriglutamate--homocysteine methyltransferase [Sphingobium baderi LL03]MBB6191237.1 5-methyltetrahydropteroyltriglutamate--homocysteine methyltransferase [Sphingobium wenxiniae]TWH95966.1 methionine synthase (B12-independent) [Sphingobium wenxiniae]
MSVITTNLGFPRIGPRRELKTALEAYWAGKSDAPALLDTARVLRAATWDRQKALGLDIVPSGDFSLYDQVLDTSIMVGAIPAIYRPLGAAGSLDVYFAMARGHQPGASEEGCGHGHGRSTDVPAQEMTKWFDTNYHYMVPEVGATQHFILSSTKVIDEYREAKALGHESRPVLLGPVSWLLLAKSTDGRTRPLSLLPALLPVYIEVLRRLQAAGAEWVQIDEPALVLDLDAEAKAAFGTAYASLAQEIPGLRILIATYFGALGDNLDIAMGLPVAGLHVDLVRAPEQLDDVAAKAPADMLLSLGVVDGRNIWKSDLTAILDRIEPIARSRRVLAIAPSCSLLHTPIDLALETRLDPQVKNWMAFAVQKIEELSVLAKALNQGRSSVAAALADNARAVAGRRASPLVHDPRVRSRMEALTANWTRRVTPFAERIVQQRALLGLPPLPTTTIGSFPQTAEVRKARAAHGKGELDDASYTRFLREETERAVRWQEEIGIDVLVHGEFERNDMVQYFGEQLAGFAFTRAGWVQSYGSRCVRPPIIYGDVSRPRPMTVEWWAYAQSLTDRPMKGMLTGPVTILQWSFVRDDQPRSDTCRQIALAIRDEVVDLERAGARIIQIDEAALREGLPLRRADWQAYLDWAVEAFRISASGVQPQTQIHTHMCYSEFNDIIVAIGAMDADVISIETARSKMELLDAFADYRYPNEIGPGVYDIHSPRVPAREEMVDLLIKAGERLSTGQLWVNPDCGLKTRKWEDVKPALVHMVEAAKSARAFLI